MLMLPMGLVFARVKDVSMTEMEIEFHQHFILEMTFACTQTEATVLNKVEVNIDFTRLTLCQRYLLLIFYSKEKHKF